MMLFAFPDNEALADTVAQQAFIPRGKWVMRTFPLITNNKTLNVWYKHREMPAPPKQSFKEWYNKNRS